MQNLHNYSFCYLPPPFSFFTYLPLNTSISGVSTPSEQPLSPLSSFLGSPCFDQHYYQTTDFSSFCQLQGVTGNVRDQSIINNCTEPGLVKEEIGKENIGMPSLMVTSSKEEQVIPKLEEESMAQVKKQLEKRRDSKRQGKKARNSYPDLDYLPEQEKSKKAASKYQINQNRNIVPNQINQIFSFVQKQNKSGLLTAKLFNKYPHPEAYTPKRFYNYQSLLKNRLGHYSNEKSLKIVMELYDPKCETWTEQEQRYYNKICRILVHHFLHEDSIFIILTSRRMKKEKKSDHLRARRQIAGAVGDVLRGL